MPFSNTGCAPRRPDQAQHETLGRAMMKRLGRRSSRINAERWFFGKRNRKMNGLEFFYAEVKGIGNVVIRYVGKRRHAAESATAVRAFRFVIMGSGCEHGETKHHQAQHGYDPTHHCCPLTEQTPK